MGRPNSYWWAAVAVLPMLLAAPTSSAGPAAPEGEVAEPAEPAAAPTRPVAQVRRDMEEDMAELGDLAADARRDTDLVRAACVLDKQERAQGVMELATSELLIIRDSSADQQSRQFAAEKLSAASDRLDNLVKAAKECTGDKSPELTDDDTNNDEEQIPFVPELDPTQTGGTSPPRPTPVPPSVDDGRPPTVGSPTQ
jgi:hypothetical protein